MGEGSSSSRAAVAAAGVKAKEAKRPLSAARLAAVWAAVPLSLAAIALGLVGVLVLMDPDELKPISRTAFARRASTPPLPPPGPGRGLAESGGRW